MEILNILQQKCCYINRHLTVMMLFWIRFRPESNWLTGLFLSKPCFCCSSIRLLVASKFIVSFRLFTMEGELVKGSSDIISGESYVAAHKERFKKLDYFSGNHNGSPRYIRKT